MSQKNKASSQNSSVQDQISKKHRLTDTQSVSKYFQIKSNSELNENTILSIESPYKNSIKPLPLLKNNSLSDDDDFQKPKIPKKNSLKWALSKTSQSQSSSKQKGKKRCKGSPNSTLKIIEDNFKYQQENGDHLQMAIALSKSTYEEENKSGRSQNEMPDVSQIFSKQNTKMSVLEKYGFSSKHKSHLSVTYKKQNLEVQSRMKSRFKYITPTLKIRTNQERQDLIASKVSMILTENISKPITSRDIHSSIPYTLEFYTPKGHSIFNFDSDDASNFYVRDLHLSVSHSKCGHLLKDWKNIPGRDISPSRIKNIDGISDSKQEPTKSEENITFVNSPVRSTSPDLFESDYESDSLVNYSMVRSLRNNMKINRSTSLPTENNLNQALNDNTQIELSKNDSKTNENIIDLTNEYIDTCEKKKRDPKFYCLSDFESDEDDNIWSNDGLTTTEYKSSSQSMRLSISKLTNSQLKCKTATSNDKTSDCYNNCHIKSDLEEINILSCSTNSNKNILNNIMECDTDNIIILSDEEQHPVEMNPSRSLENIPQTISKSLGQRIKYNDSSELNITDYVQKMLNQECLSFNQSDREDNNRDDSKTIDLSLNEKYDIITTNQHDEDIRTEGNFEENYVNNEVETSIIHTDSSSTIILSEDEQEPCIDLGDNEQHMDQDYDDIGVDLENTPERFSKRMTESQEYVDVGLDLDNTPKRSSKRVSKSLIAQKSKLYDSSELNITDYVANLLSNQNNSEENDYLSTSQKSDKSTISDEELNYSSYFSKIDGNVNTEEFNEIKCTPPSFQRVPSINLEKIAQQLGPITPKKLIVKIENVSPMRNYDEMSTPSLHKELAKYGIKPLKRSRGVKLLKHIYEATHPLVKEQIVPEYSDIGKAGKVLKKRRITGEGNAINSSNIHDKSKLDQMIEIVGDSIIECEKMEDLIFERKQSAKIPSCAIPLQIVWHNFVTSNPDIREHILLYEPLQLESLHMMLKEQGYKFHIQDLLTFLDKKCITIRTAQSQKRKK